MTTITRKQAIRRMGELALIPAIPSFLNFNPDEASTSPKINEVEFPLSDKLILQPFNYGETILHNGSLNRQVEYIKNYYIHIPNDDLLKGFRERVGLPTFGARDLGGWYTADVFHIFGQILSGLSRLYAVTGDEAAKDKTDALISGWAECLGPDGYFYYTKHPNAKHYVFDKMVGGLVDANLFTGNNKALEYLDIITEWAIKNLNRSRPYAKITRVSNEWYTLAENLYRAYLITKDQKYYDFANYWEYTEYWNLLANKADIFKKDVSYHAYSHLNTLSSAAMAYLVKGDDHYLQTLKNGYDFFQEEECFATGGYGPDEHLQPKSKLIASLKEVHNTFETQCGSWAAFKLCRYLLMFTGDARYGNWIEKLIYNGAGADIPLSPDGRVLYYSDYNPREGNKENYFKGWTCCNGTRPQDVAEYSHLIYFKNKEGIFVNLYTPSQVEWNGIRLQQETRFPERNETIFNLDIPEKRTVRFTLHFRKPDWLTSAAQLFVNDKRIDPANLSIVNNWMRLTKDWKDNDKIKVVFPMELAISRLDKTKAYPAAITYGPVVMALRSDKHFPLAFVHSLKKQNPFSGFTKVAGAPLNWHIKGFPDLLIKPYYTAKALERYLLYFDPSVQNRVLEEDIIIKGNWSRWKGCDYFYSNEKGASISTNFQGSGIRLYLTGFPNSGKCQVWIDGKPVETIDEFRSQPHTRFQKEFKHLASGNHTVLVKVLNEKNKKSKNTYINVNWFEVLK